MKEDYKFLAEEMWEKNLYLTKEPWFKKWSAILQMITMLSVWSTVCFLFGGGWVWLGYVLMAIVLLFWWGIIRDGIETKANVEQLEWTWRFLMWRNHWVKKSKNPELVKVLLKETLPTQEELDMATKGFEEPTP